MPIAPAPTIAGTPAAAAPDAPAGAPPGLPRRDAIALLLIPLVHGVGQTLIFAILPAVARDQGITDHAVSLIYMLPAIAWSLLTVWWGRHSDRHGRRRVILLGVLGFAASQLMFAAAAMLGYAGWLGASAVWWLILLSRLTYSALSSGTLPAAQAYVVSRSPPALRATAIGRLTAAWNLGNLLGPGVIGVLTVFGVLVPLFASAALAVLIWAGARQCLRSEGPAAADAVRSPALSLFDPRIRSSLAVGLCGSFAQATLLQTLGFFLMDRLGVPTSEVPRDVGIALMFCAIATLLAQTVLVQRLQLAPRTLELCGAAIGLLAFIGVALSSSVAAVWSAALVCGLGYGMLRLGNVAGASLAVGAHEQGAVAGINGALWAAGYIVSPLVVVPLHQLDPRLPFAAAALALTLALFMAQRQRGSTGGPAKRWNRRTPC